MNIDVFYLQKYADLNFIVLTHNDCFQQASERVSVSHLDGCRTRLVPASPLTSWLSAFVYLALWQMEDGAGLCQCEPNPGASQSTGSLDGFF